jgi:scyllo-inositol 2-dehydrogenase (NADP+)
MIKVAVIGYGYSAQTFHIPLINASDSFELAAISSSQKDLLERHYPQVLVFDTAEKLIASAAVDLVVITAPNDAHYPIAKQCLECGINVVVEKPMVTTSTEAQELTTIARERSLLLSVFHNRRWDGDFLTIKKLLDNNLVGDVRFFESHFDRFRPRVRQRWREQPGQGSGVWFDLGSHLVDQAISLFGLPEALTARCLTLRKGSKTTDYFHVLLHYNDLEVVLHASSFSAAPNVRFRLEGTGGSFVKYGLDPQEQQLTSGITPNDPCYGEEDADNYGRFYTESSTELIETEQGCYQQYYAEISAALALGADNPVNPEEAVEVLKILELAEISSVKGIRLAVPKSISNRVN